MRAGLECASGNERQRRDTLVPRLQRWSLRRGFHPGLTAGPIHSNSLPALRASKPTCPSLPTNLSHTRVWESLTFPADKLLWSVQIFWPVSEELVMLRRIIAVAVLCGLALVPAIGQQKKAAKSYVLKAARMFDGRSS